MFRGKLQLGELEIECHVLNDLRRVITQREIVRVISAGRDSGNLGAYLETIPNKNTALDLGAKIEFSVQGTQFTANGFEATFLIDLCNAYVSARSALKTNQHHLADQAQVIIGACAKVGRIALVDECTGYQEFRSKRDLQLKLQAFIADEMQEWVKVFPDEFWYELARLENIDYSPKHRPLRWGKYVMMFVYDAVDKDIAKELRERNPNPHYQMNHHQWLKEHGKELVKAQIWQTIGVMKTCRDMEQFRKQFAHLFQDMPLQLDLGTKA